jgi:HlyD family secretion protein
MNLPRPSSDTPLPQDMRDQAGLRPAEMSARPGDADEEAGTRRALLRPLAAGLLVTAVFVVAAAIWASFARIDSAVPAGGVFQVETNRKTLRTREGGTIREILVRDGDVVKQGQVLLRFDETVPRAQLDVLQNQYDAALMQVARLRAELAGRPLAAPAALQSRLADPRVAELVQTEQALFESRRGALEAQSSILRQRIMQLGAAREGLDMQIAALRTQRDLAMEELRGVRSVVAEGFGSRVLVLRLERAIAEIDGRLGALMAEVQRNAEQAGEARLQLVNLSTSRSSEAAAALQQAESRVAEVEPRLQAVRALLEEVELKAPVSGVVFGLRAFTEGGVASPGEQLMEIVPTGTPLILRARVDPRYIDNIAPGMSARVSLTAYSGAAVPRVHARVERVSADAVVDAEAGLTYYLADLVVAPEELARLPARVRIVPGMQATVMIVTGERTVMSYILQPIADTFDRSLREP